MPDPVEDYLRSVPTSNRVRAAAWEAVYSDAPEQGISQLGLPQSVKADLFELSQGRTPLDRETPALDRDPPVNQIGEFGSRVWDIVNPMNIAHGVNQVVLPEAIGERFGYERSGPVNFVNDQLRNTASGLAGVVREPQAAVSHLMNAVPIAGPLSRDAAEDIESGNYGRAAGTVVGTGLAAAAPEAAAAVRGRVGNMRVAPRNQNAVTREAVEFGQREGIPVDAATATGNRFVSGAQRMADESIGGSVVGGRARAAQAEALTQTGERLAQRTGPMALPEQAGAAVRDAVAGRANAQNASATAAYTRLRALEQGNPAGMAVDIRPVQSALRPVYDALRRESELVPLMGDRGRALTTLDRLMRAEGTGGMVPLSVADAALSEIKNLSRVDDAFRRTTGQAVAAKAVQRLEGAVQQAAKRGGPDVVKALQEGRQATIAKYQTIGVLDRLNTAEPVRLFNQLTASKDASASLLRDVARTAQAEMPKVGRAVIEGLLQKATAEGGFGRAQGLLADWQRLGPETRRILFSNPQHLRDLDNFFVLAKRIADNPNPSGTALTLAKGGELGLLFTNPATGVPVTLGATTLSAMLHSPRVTRVLVEGLRVPASPAARTQAAAKILRAAQQEGIPLVPAMAQDEEAVPPPTNAEPAR